MHATLLGITLLMVGQPFGDTRPLDGDYAPVDNAVVSLIDYVQLPARQAGVLKSLELEDGTRLKAGVEVQEGQVVGKLDDKDARARLRAAQTEHSVAMADKDKAAVAITAAEKTVEVARAEVEESKYVNERSPGAVPRTQLRRQELTVDRADAEAKVSHSDLHSAGLTVEARQAQVDLADINLEMHEIKSPLSGEVVNVYRQAGEWVNPGEPIARIVRLDELRVEGYIKIQEYLREQVDGQPVTVEIRLAGGRVEQFEGVISDVSPLIQAGGDYRVSCEIQNRKVNGYWVLLPGMDAQMSIKLKKTQLASTR